MQGTPGEKIHGLKMRMRFAYRFIPKRPRAISFHFYREFLLDMKESAMIFVHEPLLSSRVQREILT